MLALIDTDSIVFRCGFAVEHNTYLLYKEGHTEPEISFTSKKDVTKYKEEHKDIIWEVETVKEIEPVENCLHLVRQNMEFILRETQATGYKSYIKGKGNFRDALAVTKPYKGNRDPSHRPVYEPQIREYLKAYWKAEEVDGYEVDDKVAMLQVYDVEEQKGYYVLGAQTIICSADKDLNQVPGWHYDFIKKTKYWVTEEEAIRAFYTSLLVGDNADNIPGCAGVGVVRATKLLKGCLTEQEMFQICKKEYERVYKENPLGMMLEQGQLLWLCRFPGDLWQFPGKR